MASALSSAGRLLVVISDLFDLIDGVNKLSRGQGRGEDVTLESANIVNRVALLGLTTFEAAAILAGAKTEKLQALKHLEIIPRTLNVPIQLGVAINESDGSFFANVRVIEKGLVAPLAQLLRTGAEASYYTEKVYLEMDPQTAVRPVIETSNCDSDGCDIKVTYKPVDRDECLANMQSYRESAGKYLRTQVAADAGLGTLGTAVIAGVSIVVYQQLALLFQNRQIAQGGPDLLDGEDEVNLLAVQRIPAPLARDPILREITCSIDGVPIRNVVADPTAETQVLYERDTILHWLAGHNTSPITRRELYAAQLLERPALQALIDSRLAGHSRGLNEYLRQQAENLPVDPELRARALAEHPNLAL